MQEMLYKPDRDGILGRRRGEPIPDKVGYQPETLESALHDPFPLGDHFGEGRGE